MNAAQSPPWKTIVAVIGVLSLVLVAIVLVRALGREQEPEPGPTVIDQPTVSDGGGQAPAPTTAQETTTEPEEEPEPSEQAAPPPATEVDATDPAAVAEGFASWVSAPGLSGDEIVAGAATLVSVEAAWPLRGLTDEQVPEIRDSELGGGESVNAGDTFADWDTRRYVLAGTVEGVQDPVLALEIWVGRPLVMSPEGDGWDESIPFRVVGVAWGEEVPEAPAGVTPEVLSEGAAAAIDSLLVLTDPLRYEDLEARKEAIAEAFTNPSSAQELPLLVPQERGFATQVQITSVYWNTYPEDSVPCLSVEGSFRDLALGDGGGFLYRVTMDYTPDGEVLFTPADVIDDEAEPRPLPEGTDEESIW